MFSSVKLIYRALLLTMTTFVWQLPPSDASSNGQTFEAEGVGQFKFGHFHSGHTKFVHIRLGHSKFGKFPPPNQPPPPPPPPAVTYIYPETYGAKRDGQTNDLAAIQQALAVAAGTANSQVVFSAGTYACNGQIIASSVSLAGAANSNLLFTNPSNGGVKLTGNYPSISGITINFSNAAANSAAGLLIAYASNFSVNGIVVNACPADNIDCFYSGPGSINSSLVTSSSANSLLIEDCTNVTVTGNQMPNFGVISGGSISVGLAISNNTFTTTNGSSKGYVPKLAGLILSSFTNNTILCGSLYIGSSNKPPNNSIAGDGIVYSLYVAGNTLDGSAVTPALPDFNGIMVNYYGATGQITTDVTIAGNTVQNLLASASAIGIFPGASNINVTGNVVNTVGRHLTTSGGTFDYACSGISTQSCGNINIQNNSVSNIAGTAIFAAPYAGNGSVSITGNSISAACAKAVYGLTDEPVIAIETANGSGVPLAFNVNNNVFYGPAGAATYFIECLIPSSVCSRSFTGDAQTSTTLGNHIVP